MQKTIIYYNYIKFIFTGVLFNLLYPIFIKQFIIITIMSQYFFHLIKMIKFSKNGKKNYFNNYYIETIMQKFFIASNK